MNCAWIKSEFLRQSTPNMIANVASDSRSLQFSRSAPSDQINLFSRTQSESTEKLTPFKSSAKEDGSVFESLFQGRNAPLQMARFDTSEASDKRQPLNPIWWTPA